MRIDGRRSARRLLSGASVVACLALPMLATIWTRSSNVAKLTRGVKTPIQNATYVTREWNVTISSFEVDEGAGAGDLVTPKWHFYYRNTDAETHYVAIAVQCQDAQRHDRTRFTYTAALAPNTKDEAVIEIVSKLKAEDWKATVFVKLTIDFLSSPAG